MGGTASTSYSYGRLTFRTSVNCPPSKVPDTLRKAEVPGAPAVPGKDSEVLVQAPDARSPTFSGSFVLVLADPREEAVKEMF